MSDYIIVLCNDLTQANKDCTLIPGWKRLNRVGFSSEGKKILLISDFKRMRGRRFYKAYLHKSFEDLDQEHKSLITTRLKHLGLVPEKLENLIKD